MYSTRMRSLICLLLASLCFPFSSASYLRSLDSKGSSQEYGTIISKGDFCWADISFVYAFGDSYTFVQGSEGLDTFSFIGDLQNFSFTKEQLFSDVIEFRNTSSGGANWIEFLSECFRGHPAACSPRQLWNFAFAGSDIDGNLLPLHHNFTIPLVDQVKQWATYAASFLPKPRRKTLTAWWIGINDTGDSTGNTTITNFTTFYNTEMDSLFSAVEQAYDTGLRGAHFFVNVPPEERNPDSLARGSTRTDPYKTNIDLYNSILLDHAEAFSKSHPDVPVFLFDSNKWFNQVLDNAADFGFTNITGFCTCTNETGFFWWNSGHPTEPVHKLLAESMGKFLSSI